MFSGIPGSQPNQQGEIHLSYNKDGKILEFRLEFHRYFVSEVFCQVQGNLAVEGLNMIFYLKSLLSFSTAMRPELYEVWLLK